MPIALEGTSNFIMPEPGRTKQSSRAAAVLLVDDDRDFAAALTRLLVRDGYDITVVADTDAALEQAGQRPGKVKLVIADLHLSHHSGLDLLRELRRREPGLPVILMSASPDESSFLEAQHLGAYAYLTKPLDFGEFRQVVRRALGLARAG